MQERARQLLGAFAAAAFASAAETLPDVPGVDLDERINDMLNRLVNREDAFDVLLAIHQCRGELRPELEFGRRETAKGTRRASRRGEDEVS